MAWQIEGKDILINGFEKGISDSVYSGIADMRNMEIVSMPGEAAVEPALTGVTLPPVINNMAYTAQATGDTLTVSSTTGFYAGMAIFLSSNTAGGLSDNTVYYVHTITATTFKLSVAPSSSSAIDISSNGTGTLTTYQYSGNGGPVSYWVDRMGNFSGGNGTLIVDANNRVWGYMVSATTLPANTLFFFGNISTPTFPPPSGICIWNGYILLFRSSAIDIAEFDDVWITSGPAIEWDYSWEGISESETNSRIGAIVSQEDGNVYFTSTDGLGSLIVQPNESFDPTDTNTYSITSQALFFPSTDESTCLAELGGYLLIGGRNNFVYVWDKISPNYNSLLNIPDQFISAIVAASQNAYIFAGNRGRIYITNGSSADLFRKFPDYLTGVYSPYIRWQDASFGKNQLYFSLTASNMSGTATNSTAGIWAIDLESDALRMVNKITNSGYSGTCRMVCERPSSNPGSPVSGMIGTGLQVGWYTSGSFGIDTASSATPYTNYEAYLETEMIPVGTYLNPFTPSQIEWKAAAPLVSSESVRLYYRKNISEAYKLIGESTEIGSVSGYMPANFEKAQWIQLKVETKSTGSNPSYVRLTELRIRDYPENN